MELGVPSCRSRFEDGRRRTQAPAQRGRKPETRLAPGELTKTPGACQVPQNKKAGGPQTPDLGRWPCKPEMVIIRNSPMVGDTCLVAADCLTAGSAPSMLTANRMSSGSARHGRGQPSSAGFPSCPMPALPAPVPVAYTKAAPGFARAGRLLKPVAARRLADLIFPQPIFQPASATRARGTEPGG